MNNCEFLSQKTIVGCMRLNNLSYKEAENFVKSAVLQNATYFDHADIYGRGECESIFGEILKSNPELRKNIILQSKCGIIPKKMYDLSYEHIINSVENSLLRLKTEYLDVLLLHRPDALVEPEDVAKAFEKLCKDGKVLHFGVSNHSPNQIELLKKYVEQPLIINQLQFSLAHAGMVTCGTQTNMTTDAGISRDGYLLDYCRLNDIKIQAWSPLQYGMFKGVFLNDENFVELNKILNELSKKYQVSPATIAVAWILRHPAKIQVISGTVNLNHFNEYIIAKDIELTREEWYKLYLSTGYLLP